jgi:hypothetical protein
VNKIFIWALQTMRKTTLATNTRLWWPLRPGFGFANHFNPTKQLDDGLHPKKRLNYKTLINYSFFLKTPWVLPINKEPMNQRKITLARCLVPRNITKVLNNVMILYSSHVSYPRRSALHWLSNIVRVVLIPKTCTIFPHLKSNEGLDLYWVVLNSQIHAHLSYISRKLLRAVRCR